MFLNRSIFTAAVASLVVAGNIVPLSQTASAQSATTPTTTAPTRTLAKGKHPHVSAALRDLNQAKKQLTLETDANVSSDVRTKAISDIDTIISELKAALKE